jgi:hypothetical protein
MIIAPHAAVFQLRASRVAFCLRSFIFLSFFFFFFVYFCDFFIQSENQSRLLRAAFHVGRSIPQFVAIHHFRINARNGALLFKEFSECMLPSSR